MKTNMKEIKIDEILKRLLVSCDIDRYADEEKEDVYRAVNERIDKSLRVFLYGKIALVASLILFFFVFSNYMSFKKGYKKQNKQPIFVECPIGSKSTLTLSDGSVVVMNGGSKIIYPKDFMGEEERRVILEGEAYFEILQDKKIPFIVETNDIDIIVLGTKFDVKAYSAEENMEVNLLEGSVSITLNNENRQIALNPYESFVYNKTKKSFIIQPLESEFTMAWKDGGFYFDDLTLASIVKQLERNFGVDIHIKSEVLKGMKFSGDFIRGENLKQILDVMTLDKRMIYKIKQNQVYIYESIK